MSKVNEPRLDNLTSDEVEYFKENRCIQCDSRIIKRKIQDMIELQPVCLKCSSIEIGYVPHEKDLVEELRKSNFKSYQIESILWKVNDHYYPELEAEVCKEKDQEILLALEIINDLISSEDPNIIKAQEYLKEHKEFYKKLSQSGESGNG